MMMMIVVEDLMTLMGIANMGYTQMTEIQHKVWRSSEYE